jgi:hypothetical protein
LLRFGSTSESDDRLVIVVGRCVPDGERPPPPQAGGVVTDPAPGGVHGQHRQVGAHDETDEVAGGIADLNNGAPVRWQSVTELPSVEW